MIKEIIKRQERVFKIEKLYNDGWKKCEDEREFLKENFEDLIRVFDNIYPDPDNVGYYNGVQYLLDVEYYYSEDTSEFVSNLFKYVVKYPEYKEHVARMSLYYGWLTEDQLVLISFVEVISES